VSEPAREPGGGWNALFQRSSDAIFLLSRRRQIRYVNHAWEALTGKNSETIRGMFCLSRKKKGSTSLRLLLETLAPTAEVLAGQVQTIRRPAPPARHGPPWWDISFWPIRDVAGLTGIVGVINVVEPSGPSASGSGLTAPLVALRQQMVARHSFSRLASDTSAMQRVEAQARLAASLDAPLWIIGEPGTGKETLARIIHFQGKQREQSFLAIDAGGLQPYLTRAMIFGNTALTPGTIYLKNSCALARDLQAELVEWISEIEHPPRIMVGTNGIAAKDLREGRLVPEFASSFNVFEITLPTLRERIVDLPGLCADLLRDLVGDGQRVPEIAPEVFNLFRQHPWPGNLRELRQTLHSSLIAADGPRLEVNHLPLSLRGGHPPAPTKPAPTLDQVLEEVEKRMIRLALQKAKGNKTEAAEALGIPRARLLRRLDTENE